MTGKKNAKVKPPIVNQVSAGGVAYRRMGGKVVVAIVSVGDPARWQLPKGLIETGEMPESAAIRETREEAGVDGEIETHLDTIEYWYAGTHEGSKVRFHKLVHFYLLKYKSGEIADHDWEVNEARWMGIDEAIGILAFKSEKDVLFKAAELFRTRT